LTIKFTRHRAASPRAFSHQPSAISETTSRRANFTSPCLLIARNQPSAISLQPSEDFPDG